MTHSNDYQSLTGRWRASHKRAVRISSLVTAVVVAVFLICGAALSVVIAWQNTRSRTSEAYLRARNTAAILAQLYADAAQTHGYRDLSGVEVILENWFAKGAADKDLAWAFIRDGEGRVLVGQLRAHLLDVPPGLDDAALRRWFFAKVDALSQGFVCQNVKLQRDTNTGRETYAEVKIGVSLAHINGDFNRQLAMAGGGMALGVALLSLLMLWFLRRLILNRLRHLAAAMEDVRQGDLNTRADGGRGDEIGALAETFNIMVVGLAERAQLEDAFQRYVSKQVLEKIMISGERLQLRGETRKVTVLFSDIRGFTSMSERLRPEQIVSDLNEYFTAMVDVVFRHEGFINKFIGDAMMAVWGAPFDQVDSELHAVQAALEMLSALKVLNKRRVRRGHDELRIGIGVSTGDAVSGNIGHVERMEYTVIGDAVNIAQRIESQTKKMGHMLMVSEATYLAVANHVEAVELPTLVVKGKEHPLKLYAIKSLKTPATFAPAESSSPQQALPGSAMQQAATAENTVAMTGHVGPAPATPDPDGSPALLQAPDDERTVPQACSPLLVDEMTAPAAARIDLLSATVPPSVGDEVTLRPELSQPGAEYVRPLAEEAADPETTGGFADPVTSKLYEAEFFKSDPKG